MSILEKLTNMGIDLKLEGGQTIISPFANGYCRKYSFTIKKDGKKVLTTDFYDSVVNVNKSPDDETLLDAMYCVVMDISMFFAYDGDLSLESFCNEYGYDYELFQYHWTHLSEDDLNKRKEVKRIYEVCKKTYHSMKKSGIDLEAVGELFQDY